MTRYSYMMGAVPNTITLEKEQSILDKCGDAGWQLVSSIVRKIKGDEWTYHYFRREIKEGEEIAEKPRFDTGLFKCE